MSKKIIDAIAKMGNSLRNNSQLINPKNIKEDLQKTNLQKMDEKLKPNMFNDGMEKFKQNLQKVKSIDINSKIDRIKSIKQQTQKLQPNYLNQIRMFSEKNIKKFKSLSTDQKPRWEKMYNSMQAIKSNISKFKGPVGNQNDELTKQNKQIKNKDSTKEQTKLSLKQEQTNNLKIMEQSKFNNGLKIAKQSLSQLKKAMTPNQIQKIDQNNSIQLKNNPPDNDKKMIQNTKENVFNVHKFFKNVIQTSKNVKDKSSNEQQKTKQRIPDQNEYLKQIKKTVNNQRMYFYKLKEKSKEQLKRKSEKSFKLLSSAKDSFSNSGYTKLNYFDNFISKLFFRVTLLVFLSMLAYGIGSSIPREIRIYLLENKESNQQVKSNSVIQEDKL